MNYCPQMARVSESRVYGWFQIGHQGSFLNPAALGSTVDMRSAVCRRVGEPGLLRYFQRCLQILLPDDFYLLQPFRWQLDQMWILSEMNALYHLVHYFVLLCAWHADTQVYFKSLATRSSLVLSEYVYNRV